MQILLGYSYYPDFVDVKLKVERYAQRLRNFGFMVDSYPLTIDPPNYPLDWHMLDKKWKLGDAELLGFYEKLGQTLEHYDVFLNWNGINLHPEFVAKLNVVTIFSFFDDPESSENRSKPVAAAYDLCLVGNIAALDGYKSWGVKNVFYWPIGLFEGEYDESLTEDDLFAIHRDVDISLLCEKKYNLDRIKRLNTYSKAYPNGRYFGVGWPNGILPQEEKISLYQRTKIGPNFHNSTGPINYRTFALPANGVLQICDNKSHLAKIFKLDEEVVGFNHVKEAIELTQYYLNNENERIRIAQNGYRRCIEEYNEYKVFQQVEDRVNQLFPNLKQNISPNDIQQLLKNHRRNQTLNRWTYALTDKVIRKFRKG